MRAGAGGLRDRALGKGQVLQEHIQATVLLVEKLLHPPVGHRLPESQPGSALPELQSRHSKGPWMALPQEDTNTPNLRRPSDAKG